MRGTRIGVVVNTGEGSKFEKGDLVRGSLGEYTRMVYFPPDLVLMLCGVDRACNDELDDASTRIS
jgi:hypothetical protein